MSLKKRGRSVSRAEDLAHVNLVSYSSTPPTKAKDGSITPTRSTVDVPVSTTQDRHTPTIALDKESFPPLVQPLVTPSVMQVDVALLPITPTLPALADNPVVKPTAVRSGLASSMHAPGNTMDTSEDFSASPETTLVSASPPNTNNAQVAFEAKIEARLSKFETQLLRIAEILTGFESKLNQQTPSSSSIKNKAPTPRSFPKEVVAEVHKLRETGSLPPPMRETPPNQTSPTDAVAADVPSANTCASDGSYASSLGKRAKATLKKKIAKDNVNTAIPGSAAFTSTRQDPNTPEHVRGHINVYPPPRPMFSMVTVKTIGQSDKDRPFMKAARKVQKTPMVTLRPGATSTTEITIIRRGCEVKMKMLYAAQTLKT